MIGLEQASKVIFDTPYSSASEFYRWLQPDQLDTAMGEVCVRQTMEAANRARSAGAAVFEVFDGRHVGALAVVDGEAAYVLDPYLMPLEPIRITHGDWIRRKSDVSVPGPPLWNRSGDTVNTLVNAILAAGPGQEWVLETSLRFSDSRNQGCSIRHFRMSSGNRFVRAEFESRIGRLLLDPEQTSVSIRIVHADRAGVTQASLPLHQGGSRASYCTGAVQVKSSTEPVCSAMWARLSDSVGRSKAEICDYLVGAANLHADLLAGRRRL